MAVHHAFEKERKEGRKVNKNGMNYERKKGWSEGTREGIKQSKGRIEEGSNEGWKE